MKRHRDLILPTIAFVLIAVAVVLALVSTRNSSNAKAQNKADIAAVEARDKAALQQLIADNRRTVCAISQQRWIVSNAEIEAISEPIALPPKITPDGKDNSYSYGRTVIRNQQFEQRGIALRRLLGPEPDKCSTTGTGLGK